MRNSFYQYVGAGAAGLGAAKAAISKGLSVKVLEAATFIGGRARTDTSSLGIPYDLGCRTLYGGSDNPFTAYAKKIGFRLGLPPEKSIYHDGSQFLDAEATTAVDADFERFTAALLAAYEHAANAPGTPDKSQADIMSSHDIELATAYIGGQSSRDLALAGEACQTAWALESLRTLFGSSIQNSVLATCATPFDHEPWMGGGMSYCRSGTGNQRPALAEPIDDRVFFAGEACSLDFPGVVHGAWLSGRTAIDRITNILSPE